MIVSNKRIGRRTVFALLFAVMATAGCSMLGGGNIETRNYYILNYTPTTASPVWSHRPYPISIQVDQFEVQRIFNRQNILYRFSPHQIQYYELQQWAVRPDQMITDVVLDHLETAKLVNRVGADFLDTRPDYRLAGTVDAIEKLDAGDLFFARLAITFRLIRTSDGSQLWQYSFDQRRQVYQPDMVYTVQALSGIFQSHMDIVVSQLDSLFTVQSGGVLPVESTSAVPGSPVPARPSGGLDESTFDIVPNRR